MNHFFYVYVGVTPRVEVTTIRLKNVSGKSYKILWQKKMRNRKRISSLGKSVQVFTKNGKDGVLWQKEKKTTQL